MGPIAPNRIAPGKKLPGQMGHVTRTIQNLEVVAVVTQGLRLINLKDNQKVSTISLVDKEEETVVEEAVEAAAAE